MRPPTPTNLIAFFDPGRYVHIQRIRFKARRGSLVFYDDEWVLQVSEQDSQQMQRFTVFHEGFHILCRTRVDLGLDGHGPAHNEYLADYFAGCVLVPKRFVQEIAPKVRSLVSLAGIFQVTPSAMRTRLLVLGLMVPDARI